MDVLSTVQMKKLALKETCPRFQIRKAVSPTTKPLPVSETARRQPCLGVGWGVGWEAAKIVLGPFQARVLL